MRDVITLAIGIFIAGAILILVGVLYDSAGSSEEGTGCYVITTEDGQHIRAITAPQYNVQTGALAYKIANGEGFVFRPRQVSIDYRCVDVTPTTG